MCVPTLYVWSTGDVAFGWAAAQNTAECVQGPYTFEVLDNVSHWIPEMAPVELSQPPDPAPEGPLTGRGSRAGVEPTTPVAPARMAA